MRQNLNSSTSTGEGKMETLLSWLADSPLFIDAALLESFYDAVVKPENKQGVTTIEVNKDKSFDKSYSASGEIGIEASLGKIFETISNFFPSISVDGKGSGSIERKKSKTESKKRTIELYPIHNPQRQLVHLTIFYLLKHSESITLVENLSEESWRNSNNILSSPKKLVFLDLPNYQQAEIKGVPHVKLIPTAAEFTNGKVKTLYNELTGRNGETPPIYPELIGGSGVTRKQSEENSKNYWKWFDTNYSASNAVKIVEETVSSELSGGGEPGENLKIRWIDYRLPIADDGSTLHLHFNAAEKYNTGDFAYNLINRGYKHGLRVVGTLKSGPGINVLAVFEK